MSRGSVAPNSGTFAGPRAGYSKKGSRCGQQNDSLAQRRHAACCCGADERGYPLQGSTPQQQQRRRQLHQQQQPRGSGETFSAEYVHKLRQLGLFTNMDTPDTAHQLHAEAVAAEVAYTVTNTQPRCSGRGQSGRAPNSFRKALGMHQAARWKTAADKEIASLEKHGAFILVAIPSGKRGPSPSAKETTRRPRYIPTV